MTSSVKIFLAWFFGSFAVGFSLLFLLRPMAGLTLLIAVVTIVAMVIAPGIHLIMRKYGKHGSVVIWSCLFFLIFLFVMLGLSGEFDFA